MTKIQRTEPDIADLASTSESAPRFFHDAFIFWGTVGSFLLSLILVLIIFFKFRLTSETTALHYNILIGVDAADKGWFVLLMPVLAILMLIYNLLLARRLYRFEAFASYQLVIASGITSAVFLGAILALTALP